jgi:hypothetical protein
MHPTRWKLHVSLTGTEITVWNLLIGCTDRRPFIRLTIAHPFIRQARGRTTIGRIWGRSGSCELGTLQHMGRATFPPLHLPTARTRVCLLITKIEGPKVPPFVPAIRAGMRMQIQGVDAEGNDTRGNHDRGEQTPGRIFLFRHKIPGEHDA